MRRLIGSSIVNSFYLLSLILFVSVAVLAFFISRFVENSVAESLQVNYQRLEQATAEQTSAALKLEVTNLVEKLFYIAQEPEIISSDPNVCNARVDQLVGTIGSSVGNIGRVNAQGTFYCSHNRKLIGVQAASLGAYIPELIKDPAHKPTMGGVIKPAGASSHLVGVHVPVYDKNHNFIGTLGGAISTDKLAEDFLAKVKIGNKGFVSVLDSNGDIIYSPLKKYIGKNRYSEEFQKLINYNEGLNKAFAEAAKSGKTSSVEYSVGGEPRFSVLTGVEVLPGHRWVINSADPVSDIADASQSLGVGRYIVIFSALFALILLLALGSSILFLRRRVFRPLADFSKIEKRIEDGDLDVRISYRSHDELGRLAGSFNSMLDRLAVYRSGLEKDVKLKTEELEVRIKAFETQNQTLENNKKAMLNILEDLSVEKSLAETARLKDEALLSSIGEGLVVIDEKGNISNINPSGLRILGYEMADLHGKWFPGVLKALDSDGKEIDALDRPILRALSTGQVVTEVVNYQRKDGSTFPSALTISPVVLDGKPIGAVEVFRDITKERQLEEAKEEFVSLASHQLRTPATGVKAFVSMLLDGYAGKLTAKQETFVQKVYDTNERQLQIVNDMLNVARIDAGRIQPEFVPSNVSMLVKDILDEQTLTIKERGQEVKVSMPKIVVNAVLDPKLIRMVVENLVSNASKYTPDHGSLTVSLSASKEQLQITVADSGVGIAKSDLPKLFKRFSRIDNKLSTQRGGTGLGLYLAQNIVLLHRGRMLVDSTLGKGTTFTVEVPLKPPAKPAQTKPAPPKNTIK